MRTTTNLPQKCATFYVACNGDRTPVIKVPAISIGPTGHVRKRLRSSSERPLLLVSRELHAASSATVAFGAKPKAHRRSKPAGICRRRVPHDRPLGRQPFVVTGALKRGQHQSERMAAIGCYIGASTASHSRLFSAELPGRG